ncbi:MAG: hypothetical protein KGS72_28475 [Cyanobacteria bacterium REEB67]|nr:hypothetical protein [Cyanobacteria bacterium REEB67]
MTTYRQAADQAFTRLVTLWDKTISFQNGGGGGGFFWMCGNTLHVAIDYLRMSQQRDSYGFSEDALNFFDKYITNKDPKTWKNDPFWVDDYGWWGIALGQAYFGADVLGYSADLKKRLYDHILNCWIAMNSAWDPSLMKNIDPQVQIYGGVPNSTDDVTLSGRNCVTNEVYWRLCWTLFDITHDANFLPKDQDAATWFAAGKKAGVLFNPDGLVNERFKGTKDFNPNWNWLGDQGLFLACCFLNKQFDQNNLGLNQAISIVKSVQTSRVISQEIPVLHEELAPYSQFYLDYAGGKGVFMRNLAELNWYFHNVPGTTYDEWIRTNAAAVWNHRTSEGQFNFFWNNEGTEPQNWGYNDPMTKAVLQASGLSALTAASTFNPDTAIPAKVAATAGARD